MNEAQADAVGGGGDRDKTVRGPFRSSVTDHEKVIVVVDELVRGGKAFSQRRARGSDRRLVLRFELCNKAAKLFFGRRTTNLQHRPDENKSFVSVLTWYRLKSAGIFRGPIR